MNHSIYSADRGTHLKIMMAALCSGIVIAGLGLSSRNTSGDGYTHAMPIVKAGKSVMVTESATPIVR
ncbi:MAG: hypothetical protein JWP25_1931 [Bradyrhizobium sp.]|jgi:hypothetical protein|nr:hypothetical protein [Bradyrhizobium sp.]